MRAVFHIGAHCTDKGAIYGCLSQNRGRLKKRRIFLPLPGRYRPVIRETVNSLAGEPASEEVQQLVLDSILQQDEDPDLLFFSFDSFLGGPMAILGEDCLYPFAEERTRRYRALFPSDRVEFAIGLANPATFLPDAFALTGAADFDAFIATVDPMSLRWSDLIERIADSNPDAEITVWSHEDTPFIWPELLRALIHVEDPIILRGEDDFIMSLLTEDGRDRLRDFLRTHPPKNREQRQKIVAAFLERFASEEAVDLVIPYAGWTPDHVEALTELYDEDLLRIERMPEVRFILP